METAVIKISDIASILVAKYKYDDESHSDFKAARDAYKMLLTKEDWDKVCTMVQEGVNKK